MSLFNPALPLWASIPGGMYPGRMIRIKGHIPYGGDRFQINLATGMGGSYGYNPDIAFHFNPRFDQNEVVRNSRRGGVWENEETYPDRYLPFRKGENFEVLLLAKTDSYYVAVNGTHFVDFRHRLPLSSANTLNIEGSVQIHAVHFEQEAGGYPYIPPSTGYPAKPPPQPYIPGQQPPYVPPSQQPSVCPQPGVCPQPPYVPSPPTSRQPVYNPAIPFTYPLYGGVTPGTLIRIRGTPTPYANTFIINLQCGVSHYPPPDIGLHISVRFHQGVVVLNSRLEDSYGQEIRGDVFNFQRGMPFDLEIEVEPEGFRVSAGGITIGMLPHRIHPLIRVDSLAIEGDVTIESITF